MNPRQFALLLSFAVSVLQTASAQSAATKEAQQFLNRHCVDCHGVKRQEADLRLDGMKLNFESDESETLNLVRYKLLSGEMPPPEKPRPLAVSQTKFAAWIAGGLTKANVKLIEPDGLFLPKNGNLIDHDALFSGEIKGPAATHARIWRMSPQAYDSLAKGEWAKNVRGISQPFGGLTSPGFKDYAAAFAIDEPTADQLIRNAQAIVASQTRGEIKDGKWFVSKGYPKPVKEFVALFDPGIQPPPEALKKAAIQKQFRLILQREASDSESKRYIQLLDTTAKQTDVIQGVRTAMTAILISPEAVYRFELGDGEQDEHGRRMLSPRELAYAISFALTDRRPSGDLLRAAYEGRLTTREDVRSQVRKMFDNEKIAKPRIMRFFREYFGFHRAKDVFKDSALNPHHRADVLIRDTEHLIQWILDRDKHVFRQLMTTDRAFVNFKIDRKKGPQVAQAKNLVHTSYGLPLDWKWTPEQPIALPASERAGVLTQPSWLVANSGNFDNHPIHRGKWVREHLLGGNIPDLPITVDAQLPEEPEHTLRHRMRVTREAYCWNCHSRMNPLGLTFEIYDHFGRFRTAQRVLDVKATATNIDSKGESKGEILKSVSVDATGDIDGKATANAVAMIHHLATTDRARQMFIRYAFRYFLGRNEELIDSPTLMRADREYQDSDGSFRALVVSLLTSDSFLFRIQ